MVVKVPTVSYASLMQRYNVTSLHLLKIDTEGFDVFILRQMLNWGKISAQYPERVQFERNNLTDVSESDDLFSALQAVYDCWAPITEDDVQCLRLRDIAANGAFLPLAFSGRTHGMSVPWWRMELPDRLTVAFVQWKLIQTPMHHDANAFEVTVGDSPDVHQNHRCKAQNRRNDGKDEGLVAVCGLEGRYVAFVGSASAPFLPNLQVLVPQSDQGAFRLSMGRVCCHRGCLSKDTQLFEGYDPRCEERCRSDAACRFFTSFAPSLWCMTYADCDEELLSLAASYLAKHRKVAFFFGQLWLVLGVKLMEINSNWCSRYHLWSNFPRPFASSIAPSTAIFFGLGWCAITCDRWRVWPTFFSRQL